MDVHNEVEISVQGTHFHLCKTETKFMMDTGGIPEKAIFLTLRLIFSWLLVVAYTFDPTNISVAYITNSNNFLLDMLPLVQSGGKSWMTS